MLVYVRRSDVNADATPFEPTARTPPPHVMTAVDELNERYHRKCEEYNTRSPGNPDAYEILTCLTGKRSSWSGFPGSGNRLWIFTARGRRHPPQRSGTPLILHPLPDDGPGCRGEQAEFGGVARSEPNPPPATQRRGGGSPGRNIRLRYPL